MSRFEELARLKEQECRRQAIIAREKETGNSNRALREKMWIERDMINAVPWLLDVAGAFRPGDAQLLALPTLNEQQRWTDDRWQAAIDCLRRLQAAAESLEGDHD